MMDGVVIKKRVKEAREIAKKNKRILNRYYALTKSRNIGQLNWTRLAPQ